MNALVCGALLSAVVSLAGAVSVEDLGSRSLRALLDELPRSSAPAVRPVRLIRKADAQIFDVKIVEFGFSPAEIVVKKGSTVRWTNTDDEPHTATSAGKSFDTGPLNQNQSAQVRFDKPGTFDYFCDFHPMMKGRVVVQP